MRRTKVFTPKWRKDPAFIPKWRKDVFLLPSCPVGGSGGGDATTHGLQSSLTVMLFRDISPHCFDILDLFSSFFHRTKGFYKMSIGLIKNKDDKYFPKTLPSLLRYKKT